MDAPTLVKCSDCRKRLRGDGGDGSCPIKPLYPERSKRYHECAMFKPNPRPRPKPAEAQEGLF